MVVDARMLKYYYRIRLRRRVVMSCLKIENWITKWPKLVTLL
jgi:hypothetical protein